jgi:predicted unusual protein kinase regulating ubiquinone biosynthesis (AarF/ABC1/UbiB family)
MESLEDIMWQLDASELNGAHSGPIPGKHNERKSRYFERILLSSNKIIKPTHPAVIRLNQLLRKTKGAKDANAYANLMVDKQKNALAFIHGGIYVTTGLVDILDTEEKLLYVLEHECSHLDEKRKKLEKAKTLAEYVGALRLEEYLGDLSAFMRLNKEGRNPLEAVNLLEKLRGSNQQDKGDLVHGDTIHRIINLLWITRLMDLKGIEKPTIPLGIDLKSITPADYVADIPDIKCIADVCGNENDQCRAIRDCDLYGAIAAYNSLMANHTEFMAGTTGRSMFEDYTRRLMGKFMEAAEPVIGKRTSRDVEQKSYLTAELIRWFCCGDETQTYDDYDPENLLEVLDPELLNEMGIVPAYPEMATEFVRSFVRPQIANAKGKKAYLKKFESHLKRALSGISDKAKAEIILADQNTLDRMTAKKFETLDDVNDIVVPNPYGGSVLSDKYLNKMLKLSKQDFVRKMHGIFNMLLAHQQVKNPDNYDPDALMPDVFALEVVGNSIREHFRTILRNPLEILTETIKAARTFESKRTNAMPSEIDYDCIKSIGDFSAVARALTDNDAVRRDYRFATPVRLHNEHFIANDARGHLLNNATINSKDPQKALEAIRSSLAEYPRVDKTGYAYDLTRATFGRILSMPLNPENPEHLELLYLYSLFQTELVKTTTQNFTLPRILEKQSFDECYRFVSQNLQYISTPSPIEFLIDEKADTPKRLKRLRSLQKDMVNLLTEKSAAVGEFVFNDLLQKNVETDRLDLLKCALKTQFSEYELKMLMCRLFDYNANRKLIYNEEMNEDPDFDPRKHAEDWLEDHNFEQWGFFDIWDMNAAVEIEPAYMLDLKQKYAFLRMVLADPQQGVLTSPRHKKRLAGTLLEEMVRAETQTDRNVYPVVEKVLDALVQQAPIDLAYFAIFPILIDKIFIRPEKKTESADVILDMNWERFAEGWLPDLSKEEYERGRKEFSSAIKSQSLKKWLKLAKSLGLSGKDALTGFYNKCAETVHTRLEKVERFYGKEIHPVLYSSDKMFLDSLNKFFGNGKHDESRAQKKLSTLEFICECAKNLGSPGVRFLQLLGQYTTMPAEYSREFQKVYDNIHGQSKLTAWDTVSREWADAYDKLETFEKSVGGGSLTTVYRARTVDSKDTVVKVLNPNRSYINRISFNVIREALTNLSKNDARFTIGVEILDDIAEWINSDTNFTGFLPKDREFNRQNHGFKGANGYSIMVPKSYGPENKYFKREDYVEGTNLTKAEELREQGHDLKAITSTIAQNYMQQLGRGLVHSDVHSGNFRITKDKRIAILDRNFFLEFNEQEKQLFYSAFMYANAGKEGAAKFSAFLSDYLGTIPENRGKFQNPAETAKLAKSIGNELGSDSPLAERMMGVVRYLRVNKYKLPLKTTLLVRNMHALQKFAETAGFNSLEEALSYRAA